MTSPNTPNTDVLTAGHRGRALPALRVVVVAGPDAGAQLLLGAGTYRVGKAEGCDLLLTDSSVSRVHLSIQLGERGARFVDQGSTNGSFFQDVRFDAVDALPGTTIRIGRTELRLLSAASQRLPQLSREDRFGALFGRSARMRELFGLLHRCAASASDVLLRGETGTGKELCAEALHQQSPRAKGPFVVADLAGTPPALMESELFGHVRGAFTGAVGERAGAFERAHGGTVFLDEIGELPLEVQPRLLRVLERRQVKRVGSNDYRSADFRVIAATHRDLASEVAAGRFREDLLHRLAVLEVVVPPLRERREDIPLLVSELLAQQGHPRDLLGEESVRLLSGYDWPGNVRELRNVVARVVSLGEEVGLPQALAGAAPSPSAVTGPPSSSEAASTLGFKEAKDALLHAFERDYLEGLLSRCEWNISRASRDSGVNRVHLRRLMHKHGLYVPPEGGG